MSRPTNIKESSEETRKYKRFSNEADFAIQAANHSSGRLRVG